MTPLERAARALWDDREQHQHPRCRQTWEQGSETARRYAMDHTRAVLLAIREPDAAMIGTGGHAVEQAADDDDDIELARAAWPAMIDALLAEGA